MVYAFDNCELDTQRITLRRAGQTIPLRPKVFQVLLHLLTHRERIVDKQELCEQVWPEQFISDATLESTLRAVRRAIGDSGKEQRLIQTLYGHGYRFVAPVTLQPTTREDDEDQEHHGEDAGHGLAARHRTGAGAVAGPDAGTRHRVRGLHHPEDL